MNCIIEFVICDTRLTYGLANRVHTWSTLRETAVRTYGIVCFPLQFEGGFLETLRRLFIEPVPQTIVIVFREPLAQVLVLVATSSTAFKANCSGLYFKAWLFSCILEKMQKVPFCLLLLWLLEGVRTFSEEGILGKCVELTLETFDGSEASFCNSNVSDVLYSVSSFLLPRWRLVDLVGVVSFRLTNSFILS